MALGKAVVNIQANLAPLKRGLARARTLLGSSLKGFATGILGGIASVIKRTMSAIVTTVKRAVAIITAATIAIGIVSVKAASDMVEANNLFAVSFGKLTKEMENWTLAFADSLKLNQTNIKGFVGTFNLMFTGMDIGAEKSMEMSKRLTELAIDLSSLRDIGIEEAFIKIRAGIVGEAEPLRRLGILLNDEVIKLKAVESGLIKQGKELTQNQKVMVRYDELIRQTSRDTGDFARTMDEGNNIFKTFKEQIKNVREEIGQSLLPTVSRIALKMRDWLFNNRKQIRDWADVAVFKIEHFVSEATGKILSFIEIAKMDGLPAAIRETFGDAIDRMKEVWESKKPGLIKFAEDLGSAIGRALVRGLEKTLPKFGKLVKQSLVDPFGRAAAALEDIDAEVRNMVEASGRNRAINRAAMQRGALPVPAFGETPRDRANRNVFGFGLAGPPAPKVGAIRGQ